jgi:type IV pilus assembly protein PilC
MATFIYEATDARGLVTRGEHESRDRGETFEFLRRRGLTPLSIERLHSRRLIFSRSLFGRVTTLDVLFLMRNLAAMLAAGLSIDESLGILIEDSEKERVRKLLERLRSGIENGTPLSRVFEKERAFPSVFIGMIKAGELSGRLDKTFGELSALMTKEHDLKQKVRAALTYPLVLLVASVGVVTLLLVFVMPKLTKAFESGGVELPLLTRFFMAVSSALTWNIPVTLGVLVFGTLALVRFRKVRAVRAATAAFLARAPLFKEVVIKVALTRFTRTFGNLIGSGISVLEALELTAESVGNRNFETALRSGAKEVERGVALSDALRRTKVFPKVVISLIAVGEKTGSLSAVLVSLSSFYEDEVDSSLKTLTSLLEPVLLLVMGLVVGSIAISILMPIYQLVGRFS